MPRLEYKDLLNAGVHFGHMTRKWNPKMAPYIFMERNGIHVIDLNKTTVMLDEACEGLKRMVRAGRKVMFVATKKQAKELVAEEAQRLNMPYVTERWLGGMLTNFTTVRKSLRKMSSIDKLMKEDTFNVLAKRERLMVGREREKLGRVLGGISDLSRLPAALFIVDIKKEHIAVSEARKLGIPIFAMVDTNSDPTLVDFPIPANDDAYKSIAAIMKVVGEAVEEGLSERKRDKDSEKSQEEEAARAREERKAIAEKKALDQNQPAATAETEPKAAPAAEAPAEAKEEPKEGTE